MTSAVRVAPVRLLADVRPPSSFRNAAVLPRATTKAGTRPKTNPVASASAIVNARTAGCSDASGAPGSWRLLSAIRARIPINPSASPPMLPAIDSTMPSVSNCRTMRQWPAPSVVRIASSR